jgi:SNF2 family DNA or RNA helicase
MNALKYSKACEQMSEAQWLEFCRFWRIVDGSEARSHKLRIQVPGMKMSLFPYQAYLVWWQLMQIWSPIRGGICGDEMGLGKVSSPGSDVI